MYSEIRRAVLTSFCDRLREPRRFLQVVAGPRQVGKTTLVRQALSALDRQAGKPIAQHSVSADNPGLVGSSWLSTQWETARALAARAGACILVLDEVQKLPGWTEEVKRLWDEDTRAEAAPVSVDALLGSVADSVSATPLPRTIVVVPADALSWRLRGGAERPCRDRCALYDHLMLLFCGGLL